MQGIVSNRLGLDQYVLRLTDTAYPRLFVLFKSVQARLLVPGLIRLVFLYLPTTDPLDKRARRTFPLGPRDMHDV